MTLCPIHGVAFGGDGVGKIEHRVIFVPFTLPEELVEISLTNQKKRFARGTLQNIIQASPHRVTPPCSYFTRCGGCQLQHASYAVQLQLKKRFVEDSLLRIGHICYPVPDVVPSDVPFSYRRHISLKLHPINECNELSFTAIDAVSLLPIEGCLLFHETPQDPFLLFLRSLLKKLPPLYGTVKLVKTNKDLYAVAITLENPLSTKDKKLLQEGISSHQQIEGLFLRTPQGTDVVKEANLQFVLDGLCFSYSPWSFLQNHPTQSRLIYQWIVRALKAHEKVLDLYCGIGISSLLLAKEGKKVHGVEINQVAVELAKSNAQRNNLSVSFFCAPAEKLAPELLSSFQPDALVINPPKTGIDPSLLHALSIDSSLHTILYISCNPTTLARDLALLVTRGFLIRSLQCFDMFPQTTHVETVVCLQKNTPVFMIS